MVRDNLEDLDVGGRRILNWFLEKWTCFICPRIRTSEVLNEFSDSIKCWKILE
jgi:hypothetical protein